MLFTSLEASGPRKSTTAAALRMVEESSALASQRRRRFTPRRVGVGPPLRTGQPAGRRLVHVLRP